MSDCTEQSFLKDVGRPMTDAIKKAESNGYSKGYAAGKRRATREEYAEQRRAIRQALMDQVYIALLPTAMTVQGWTMNGQKIADASERAALAAEWVRYAMNHRPMA